MSLRVMFQANAPWVCTGYGVQGKHLTPRLRALGHEVAYFAFYGLDGGILKLGDVTVYPRAHTMWGQDIVNAHMQHFKGDLLISLLDVWVLDNYGKIAETGGWLWCVPGETELQMTTGTVTTIQDVVKKRQSDPIWGMDAGMLAPATVNGWHYVGIRNVLEITTNTGRRLRMTPDSGVCVCRDGTMSWVQASCIVPGDMVYCTTVYHKQGGHDVETQGNCYQLDAEAHGGLLLSAGHESDRVGVRSRDHRWRGKYNDPAHTETLQANNVLHFAAASDGAQLQPIVDGLAPRSDRLPPDSARQASLEDKLCRAGLGVQSLRIAATVAPVSAGEATACGAGDVIHHPSGRRSIQRSLQCCGTGDLDRNPTVELEEVAAVRTQPLAEPVYDLTTSTTNFFANGILIHNCPWTPIDQEPVPKRILQNLEGAYQVLPYAKHGEEQLRTAGVQNVRYIPHGVDTKTFCPGDRAAARRELKLPEGAFVIGMVAANKGFPSRKCFAEQLMAFARFKETHPDAIYYLHTLRTTEQGGVAFPELLERLGLVEGRDVFFSDQYTYHLGWAEKRMAMMYQAFDVLSLVSSGEGFGIPLIEAQACGIPVVTARNTAMTELTFAGASVTGQRPTWTPLGAWAQVPDVDAIGAAYESVYEDLQDPATREQMSARARAGAMAFDWDAVVEHFWKPFLADVEAEIAGRRREHRWAKVGLRNEDGTCSTPCLDKGCAAELVRRPGIKDDAGRVVGQGMPMAVDGMALDIEDDPQGGVAKIMCREAVSTYRLPEIPLQDGDWVVDVGAHVGVASIYLAKKHPGVKVLAIEPVPANYERLVRNIEANGVMGRVIPVPAAVTGDGREVRLWGHPDNNSGGMSAYVPADGVDVQQETVGSRTLCSLMREQGIERIKLLMMDCEGEEYGILDHGAETPLHKVEYLVGEFHSNKLLDKLGNDPQALLATVTAHLGADKVHVSMTRMDG